MAFIAVLRVLGNLGYVVAFVLPAVLGEAIVDIPNESRPASRRHSISAFAGRTAKRGLWVVMGLMTLYVFIVLEPPYSSRSAPGQRG